MSKRVRVFATIGGLAAAAFIFCGLFVRADASATWRAVSSAGPLVGLALGPFALAVTLDSCGSVALLRALGHPTTLLQVLPVRVASEALHLSVPAGFVASDTAAALLLERRADVPLRDGVVTAIARKWLVMQAHGAYILLGAFLGFSDLAALSRRLTGGDVLPWVVLASAAIPFAGSWAVGAGLLGRTTFTRLHALLSRIPSRRVAPWLEARRHEAVATGAQAELLRSARPATAAASVAFLGCWCMEALESALLIRLVGANVGVPGVVSLEAALSLVRSLTVVAPSGLGVVDVGYATVLPMLGADAGSAAAFVLLKRAKELAWIVAGYTLLGAMRGRSRVRQSFPNAPVLPSA
jgi:uncharacterized membrane protein YbhN (UPF0104 family)